MVDVEGPRGKTSAMASPPPSNLPSSSSGPAGGEVGRSPAMGPLRRLGLPLGRRTLPPPGGLLAGMRIRKKLIVLHTAFSVLLAAILAIVLYPSIMAVVRETELQEAKAALTMAELRISAAGASNAEATADILQQMNSRLPSGVRVRTEGRGWSPEVAGVRLEREPGQGADASDAMVAFSPLASDQGTLVATAKLYAARQAVSRLIVIVTLALLAVYALIAISLEVFVLPRHVYGPIRRILMADHAVQEGQREAELIPDRAMPADELGEIMRSRNATVEALRMHESELATALTQLESTANDLKRKNHLLETAQRNLADADRLASLGVMSAGLAHEMNTPLAVVKGLSEKVAGGQMLTGAEAQLLLRVTGRLERLSESLLDFARVRPPTKTPTPLRELVDEAWTLVKLDRAVGTRVELVNAVEETCVIAADGDRLMQVLVNLLRNAAEAMVEQKRAAPGATTVSGASLSWAVDGRGKITVNAEGSQRDGQPWVSITITDEGPGLDPQIVGRLFEPFASTRLDSRGTGLGLAVSEGIVKEHGGLLLARNREGGRGAVFEIMMPR